MNIYIKIEIKSRELESRMLLAMAAAERGHKVFLGSHPLTLSLAEKKILKPGIILEKSITPTKDRISQLLNYRKNGCITTSLDEEGGFIDNKYDIFMKQRYSEQTIKLTDKIFTWGAHDYKNLINNFKKFKFVFAPTGNPRVDYWRDEFKSYYKNQKLLNYPSKRKFVLLTSNFGAMVHQQKIWQDVELARLNQYFERGADEYDNYEFQSYQIRLNAKFVKLLHILSKKFPRINFVIRPHPTESLEAWKAIIGNYKNIFVIQEGSVGKWIRKSSLVMHNSCTSGIESFASKVPTIAYRPLKSRHERKFPNSFSRQIFNEKNFINELKNIIIKKKIPMEINSVKHKKNLLKRFINLENKLSVDRIIDEWEKLDNGELNEKNNLNNLKIVGKYKDVREKIPIKKLLLIDRNYYFDRSKYKFPPIKKAEISEISKNLIKTLRRFNKVKINQISSRLIYLYRN